LERLVIILILNESIVSPLLLETIKRLQIPILDRGKWIEKYLTSSLNVQSETQFFYGKTNNRLLTNSENGISLLGKFFPESKEYLWSKLLKDKSQVRSLFHSLYPDFYFNEVPLSQIDEIPKETIPFPVVVKPNIGYSSVGVQKVKELTEWSTAVKRLKEELLKSRNLYESTVIANDSILIEEWIKGEEYAVDGYYNEDGEPVILNVFKRLFKDEYDTSDRIYFTSREVIKETYEEVLQFMRDLKTLLPLCNYPVHFEFRKNENRVIPIEINPLRFAGAGTTDLGFHAYGINMYEHYFRGTKPDWEHILETMDHYTYSFFFAEIPTYIDIESIETVNHIGLKGEFSQVLEYRMLPKKNDRSIAIVFYRSEDLTENERLLHLDITNYLHRRELVFK